MTYAINVADLTNFIDTIPVQFAVKPLIAAGQIVDCEPKRIDGHGVVVECGDEMAEALIFILRKKWKANELRIYRSTGKAWKRV